MQIRRSKSLNRDKDGIEKYFGEELENLRRGLEFRKIVEGPGKETLQKLNSVALHYIDELNKVRPKACPLSTSMLLSALMETILNDVCIQRTDLTHKTNAWERWQNNKKKNEKHPDLFTLIQIVHEMKLLTTSDLNDKKVGNLQLDYIFRDSSIGSEGWQLPKQQNAKRNRENLHTLRNFRNAIHPMKLIEAGLIQVESDSFLTLLFGGLRLLLLLEELMGIEARFSSSTS